MQSPEDKLSITADPVQTFAPFDFVTAQTRFKSQGAGSALKSPAARQPNTSLSPVSRYDSEPTPTIILREALTIAALAGILWFQYEIIRCFW